MSPDQAEPQRLQDLVDAFAQSSQAVLDLARACTDDDLAQPTDCPGWTVHDQIAHVAGVEAWLAGRKDPRVKLPSYDYIKHDFGRKVEYAVEVRRGRTGAELVAELEDVLTERLSTLRSPTLTATTVTPGPFGPDQAATVIRLRTFDVWAHEQDIRSALRRPGDLDSAAAAVFVSSVMLALPRLVAKEAGVEPGHPVVIDVTGPGSAVTARQGVQVQLDERGRPRGHAIFGAATTGDAGQLTRGPELEGTTTTISLTTEAFTRRAAGRRSLSDTAYRVVGDEGIARRVLEALVVTH